jgi:hypothetical protein
MGRITGDIAVCILLLNCILYFKNFFNFDKAYKLLCFYLLNHLGVEIAMRTLSLLKMNNHFVSHFYLIFQFLILSFFFLQLLNSAIQKRRIRIFMVLCLNSIIIQYLFIPEMFFKFNPFEIFITSFPLIIFATLTLFEMLDGKKEFFIVIIAIVVYLFGSTIVFLFGNIINSYNLRLADFCWALNTVLYLILQIIFLVQWKLNYSKIKA